MQDHRGFDADKNLTALHIRISGQSILAKVRPAGLQNGTDPATFSGFYAGGAEAAFGYRSPTSWSTMPCAIRTSIRASGAA